MVLRKVTLRKEPSSLKSSTKFTRRADLSPDLRRKIGASVVLGVPRHGKITALSAKHNVSRPFIYDLAKKFDKATADVFGFGSTSKESKTEVEERNIEAILQLRLAGGCSLSAVSSTLEHFGLPNTSTGYVSQTIQSLGSATGSLIEWEGECAWSSDEIFFAGHQPILMTVDVHSSAILHVSTLDKLSGEAWKTHWGALKDRGITPLKLISDGGTALKSAQSEDFSDIDCQPDTFHAVAHRLGVFHSRLWTAAENSLEVEYDREKRFESAKTEATLQKIVEQHEEARKTSARNIELFDNFSFLYKCMVRRFDVFDVRDGSVHSRRFAEQETLCALELMRTLDVPKLDKHLDEITKLIPKLFAFLDAAKEGLDKLRQIIDPEALPFWTSAWQWGKKALKIKGKYELRKKLLQKRDNWLTLLKSHYEMTEADFDFEALARCVFRTLDATCAQSSAAVENANSFVRPFLNQSRDQISQETLNLIMFYFNHRRFKRGERKGRSPMEILTGKTGEADWLTLIMDKRRAA